MRIFPVLLATKFNYCIVGMKGVQMPIFIVFRMANVRQIGLCLWLNMHTVNVQFYMYT
jgi:hypothetical protein